MSKSSSWLIRTWRDELDDTVAISVAREGSWNWTFRNFFSSRYIRDECGQVEAASRQAGFAWIFHATEHVAIGVRVCLRGRAIKTMVATSGSHERGVHAPCFRKVLLSYREIRSLRERERSRTRVENSGSRSAQRTRLLPKTRDIEYTNIRCNA